MYTLQNLYSCRAELETEIEQLNNAIERARAVVDYSDDDVTVLQEGAKAQSLLPFLELLCDDEKFRSVEQIQEEIDKLTSTIQNMEDIQDRIPMGRKVQHLKSLLELNGVTDNERKPPGRSVGSTRDGDSEVFEDTFYRTLVEAYSDDIVFKVHDLAFLVSNIHQMKVFYTFLNHLYRSQRISQDDRQRYTLKALQELSKTICKSDSQLMAMQGKIVEKCRQDGILIHGNGIASFYADSVATMTEPVSSLASNLSMIEFRVGEVLPRTPTQSQTTPNSSQSDSIVHRVVLAQAQALGRSLKELHDAIEAHDDDGASTAAICSILNALSFGQTIFGRVSSETVGCSLLHEIVDYGDVNHIRSVVEQTGNEKFQTAFQQGIAVVQKSIKQLSLKRDDEAMREQTKAGSSVLATVIGHFANEVMKWTRDAKCIDEKDAPDNAEAISLLALVVTTKMTQTVAESVKHEQNMKSLSLRGREHSSAMAPKIVKTSPLKDSGSSRSSFSSRLIETWRGGQATPVVQRIARLEESVASLVGELETKEGCHATSLVERMTRLEESVSSLVDELKAKRTFDERIQTKFEQLEHRMCKWEEFLGYAD